VTIGLPIEVVKDTSEKDYFYTFNGFSLTQIIMFMPSIIHKKGDEV